MRVAVSQPTQRIPGPRVPQAVRPTVRGIVLDHVELERHLLDPVEHAVEVADVGREDRGARPLAGAREERSAQALRVRPGETDGGVRPAGEVPEDGPADEGRHGEVVEVPRCEVPLVLVPVLVLLLPLLT